MKHLKWSTVVVFFITASILLTDSSYAARGYDRNLGFYNYDDIWLDEPDGFTADYLYSLKLEENDMIVTFSRFDEDDSTYRYDDLQPGNYRYTFTKRTWTSSERGPYRSNYDFGHITFSINEEGHFENVQAEELLEGTSLLATDIHIRYRGEYEYDDNFRCRLGGCYPRWRHDIDFTLYYQTQSSPTLDILSDDNTNVYADYEGYNIINVEGYVQDLDNDPVTITVTIDGVEKSQTIHNTEVARLFSIPFDVISDKISGGEHTVTITADDTYYNGRVTKTYPIKVASIVGANQYVLVDTPLLYFTEYSDYENDPLYAQQYRYIHDEHHFENSLGKIPDSGIWRNRYESLAKPGHYQIDFRNRDNPKNDDRFDEFRKWSPASPVLDLYVHRKPIAKIDVFLDREDRYATYYDLEVVSSSYDLDHESEPGAGISAEQWSWKYPGASEWTAGKPPGTIHRTSTLYVQLMVQDVEGAWSDPAIREINPSGTYLPIAGFTVDPDALNKNQETTITSTAGHERANEPITHQYYIKRQGEAEYAYTTDPDWTIALPDPGTYTIRQVVTDRNGYSAQHSESITVSNRLPSATITTPGSSTISEPTPYEYEEPVWIRWTYTDPDHDPQTRYQLQIYQISNGSKLFDSGEVNRTVKLRQVDGLPRGQTMRVQVRVHDGTDWSSWSALRYFYIIDNKPPIADFTWSPTTIWEGDRVQLTNRSSDPDGDALTYLWEVMYPDGSTATSRTEHWNLRLTQVGSHHVQLTASDGRLTSTVTKTLQVRPLTITANVDHTELWYAFHREAGHETEEHPKDFYSGEKLLLSAVTSPAPVDSVVAVLKTEGADDEPIEVTVSLTQDLEHRYKGEMYDERFSSMTSGLPQGLHNIEFRVRYANGTIKTTMVPIRIIGHVLDTAGVHRRQ